jgi:hypothetical protein
MTRRKVTLAIHPTVDGVVRYLVLPPSSPNGNERFQFSFEATFTNHSTSRLKVETLGISFPTFPDLGPWEIKIKTLQEFQGRNIVTRGLILEPAGESGSTRAPMDFRATDNIVLTSAPPPTIRFEVFADGKDEPMVDTYPVARHESPVSGGAYVWMAKAHDLLRGEYWSGIGADHCCGHQLFAHDLKVHYFDSSANVWTKLLPEKDDEHNEHYRIWNKPVYAMAAGIVVNFDYTILDNLNPPHLPANPPSIYGNFFEVRHGTDRVVYAHFRHGYMNEDLMARTNARVRAGEFLGRVGNSGNASEPHLHIHCVDDASGTLRPIPWKEKMVARREETSPAIGSDWRISKGQGLAVVKTLIYPGDIPPADDREWSDWEWLGGGLIFGPTVCSWGPNRLDIFGVGTNRALWHIYWNGSRWSDWEDLGGQLKSKPAAVSWGPNRIDIFGRCATDNSLCRKVWDGSRWLDWERLGGTLTSGPAVSSRGVNRLDVFVLATDSSLYHKRWDGSRWRDWEGLGGKLTADPAAVSWNSDRIDVFGRGTNETLWHKSWNGSTWSDWEPLNRPTLYAPAVSSRRENRLDIFVVAPDGTVQHMIWNGSGWTGWESVSGLLTGDPAAVSWNQNRIDVFGRGGDNALWHTHWTPS